MHNGETSFWWRDLGGAPPRRAPLDGDVECDVAIVGGGYTGLWTAYYLKQADPSLKVMVIEKEFCGFGASGRNGGWLSGLLAGSREKWAKEFGRAAVSDAQRQMFATVREVARVCEAEGIECDLEVGGELDVATSRPGMARLSDAVAYHQSWGFGDEDWRIVGLDEVERRVRVNDAIGGVYTPHCARIHPAKLVRGLADVVEKSGVDLRESTAATDITPNGGASRGASVTTDRGTVTARWVVRATEGYTHGLAPRRLIPMNSCMIVTEPGVADQVGWTEPHTLRETAHLYCYLQRTRDGRIAIGGRGIPYRYGSKTDHNGELAAKTITELTQRLHHLFPSLIDKEVQHGWAGVLGVSRDWCPAVLADTSTGLAEAGGYVGDGVSTANLAGRTLRDLILEQDTELTRAPWTKHRPKTWEPEPARFIGIRSVYRLFRAADAIEERTQKPSRLAALATRVSGR